MSIQADVQDSKTVKKWASWLLGLALVSACKPLDFEMGELGGCIGYCGPGPAFMTKVQSTINWQTGDGECGLSIDGDLICKTDAAVDEYAPLKTSPHLISFLGNHNSRCVLDKIGTAYCWGPNSDRRVLPGGPKGIEKPTKVGDFAWRSLAIGDKRTCGVVKVPNEVMCWGTPSYDSRATDAVSTPLIDETDLPIAVTDTVWRKIGVGFESLDNYYSSLSGAGVDEVLCGLTVQDILYCYRISPESSNEILVASTNGWLSLQIGDGKVCGLTERKTIECIEFSIGLMRVLEGNWIAFDRDSQTACGIQTDSSLWCWGLLTGSGELYSNTNPHYRDKNWKSIHVDLGACATKSDGVMYCLAIPRSDYGTISFGSNLVYVPTPVMVDSEDPK